MGVLRKEYIGLHLMKNLCLEGMLTKLEFNGSLEGSQLALIAVVYLYLCNSLASRALQIKAGQQWGGCMTGVGA